MDQRTTDTFKQRGLNIVPEVSDKRFSMTDDGAVEVETGELIYGFVRRLKPTHCLSTGIYTGMSDLYIAKGLQDNGMGHLTALEYEQYHIDRARDFWTKMGVAQHITSIKSDSLKYTPTEQSQFMFLDTEPSIRLQEAVNFYPFLDAGGYMFIHDMPPNQCRGNVNTDHPEFPNWPIGEIPKEFDALIKEKKLLPFYFPDARSLMGLYKPTERDFI